MTPFVLVTGDFVHTGGMDAANFALARYLGRTGAGVHLVAHRADAELRSMPNVSFHHVTKPGGSYLLGALLLRRAGERWARRLAPAGARQVVNGGNCISADTNWVHYVHAAHEPLVAGAPVRLAMRRWMHRRYLTEERQALRRARLVIANSNRTRTDVIDRVGVPPARVRTVYYGTDPTCHRPPTTEERRAARQALGWSDDAPGIAFVGALGDRRKGFDTVFAAWEQLSADATWTTCLAVVGAGHELPVWRARAQGAELAGRIRFVGFTRDVRRVLWACDAIVAPSRYEAYGLAVHEAVCCGLPAIVSADAGIAERLPGLVPLQPADPANPSLLADAIRRWHSGRAEWSARALAASAVLRAWTWDDMAAHIVCLMTRAEAP